jgi:hypothetical protein
MANEVLKSTLGGEVDPEVTCKMTVKQWYAAYSGQINPKGFY